MTSRRQLSLICAGFAVGCTSSPSNPNASETQSATPAGDGHTCSVFGDLVIDSDAAAEAARGVCGVGGRLIVGGAVSVVDLPALETVGGVKFEGADNLTTLRLTQLTDVLGDLDLTTARDLTDLALGDGVWVEGEAWFMNLGLDSLSIGIHYVGGGLHVESNEHLAELIVRDPYLTIYGVLHVTNNDVLTTASVDVHHMRDGDVDIAYNPMLTSIDLASLINVSGDVFLDAPEADLRLDELAEVEGDLYLTSRSVDLPKLFEVAGDLAASTTSPAADWTLDVLMTVDGVLNLDLPGVTRVSAPMLTRVDGAMWLDAPDAQTVAFPLLDSIGGDLVLNLDVLPALSLPALTTVAGGFAYPGLELATSVEVPLLEEVGGDLAFAYMPQLTTLDLHSLQQVPWNFVLRSTPALAAPSMHSDLQVDGDIWMVEVGMTDLSWLPLSHHEGSLFLDTNPALQSLDGLEAAEFLIALEVTNNPVLNDVSGLGGLSYVGALTISYNGTFTGEQSVPGAWTANMVEVAGGDLTALGFLDGLLAVDDIYLEYATHLERVVFEGLSDAGTVDLVGCYVATTVSFPSLTHADRLSVAYMGPFEVLSAPRLSSAGTLEIIGNDNLTTLDLPALARIDTGLAIQSNPALPTCAVDALLAQIEAAEGFGGNAIVNGNDDLAVCF